MLRVNLATIVLQLAQKILMVTVPSILMTS